MCHKDYCLNGVHTLFHDKIQTSYLNFKHLTRDLRNKNFTITKYYINCLYDAKVSKDKTIFTYFQVNAICKNVGIGIYLFSSDARNKQL